MASFIHRHLVLKQTFRTTTLLHIMELQGGVSRLSGETMRAHFKTIATFAEQFLKGESVDGQVLYNEKQERIDFRFKTCDEAKDIVRLVITFEPGYPYHWHDEDKWDKL
jgi:hypothetical protein